MSERSFDTWRRFAPDDSRASGPRVERPTPVGRAITTFSGSARASPRAYAADVRLTRMISGPATTIRS